MISRPTWILLSLYAITLAAAEVFQRFNQEQEKTPEVTPPLSPLFDFPTNQIILLRLENFLGRVIVNRRDEAGLWKVTQPGGETDLAALESGITQLISLRPSARLESSPDLSLYGFDGASATISIELVGGESHFLLVGDESPIGNGFYVRLNEDQPIVVNKYSLEAFLRMAEKPPIVTDPVGKSSE